MSVFSPEVQLIAGLLSLIQEQKRAICKLQERCSDLEARLNKNSKNSSKPPSSDGYTRTSQASAKTGNERSPRCEDKPSPKSLRSSSGLKSGAQKGHKGSCLKAVEKPDHVEYHQVETCAHCQQSLAGDTQLRHIEYQVFEPACLGHFEVTAHRVEVRRCTCGHKSFGSSPDGVTAHVQYGPKTRVLAVYLHQYQLIPCARVAEFFRDAYTLPISPGSICTFQKTTYDQLEATELAIASALVNEEVLGADETGIRVRGKTN